jgi:hypothetical protein
MFCKLLPLAATPLVICALAGVAHAEPAAAPAQPLAAPAPAGAPAGSNAAPAAGPATPATDATPSPPVVVAPAPAPVPVAAEGSTPVVPAPAAAPPPVAAVSAPVVATPRAAPSPGEALVHVGVSHKDAWLEMRSYVDGGEFLRICRAPCDLRLQVEGREARVTAPGMTTSNVFRFDAGQGTAGVRVNGGSASARRAGVITLAIGIPLALAGMGLFAQGRVRDNTGLTAAGIAGLSAGGLSIAVSLPLLLIGTTHVKDAKGSQIAFGEPHGAAL